MLRAPAPLILLFALLAIGCSQPAAIPQGPAQGNTPLSAASSVGL